jgi:AAA domain
MTAIDFDAINRAASADGRSLVERLVPGGKFRSLEYRPLNPRRNDHNPGSFSINYRTGHWADFATSDKGGDFVSLVAYIKGIEQSEAATELARMISLPLSRANGANGVVRKDASVDCRSAAPPVPRAPNTTTFPTRTPRDAKGKPAFIAGDAGPIVGQEEMRRHIYRRGDVPVRIKIKFRDGRFANWYRVTDAAGATGWQASKPTDFIDVPYVSLGIDPFDPEVIEDPIYWPEGERDVDSLTRLGMLAFTFGGTGDGLPPAAADHVAGRDVVILADNDDAGRKHAQAKAIVAYRVAKSVKIVEFPELPKGGDVSDWVAEGHTAEELNGLVESAPTYKGPTLNGHVAQPTAQPAAAVLNDRTDWWRAELIDVHKLCDQKFPEIRYVVPGLFPEGVTLLASRPKLGKSWLLLQIGLSVANGTTTLVSSDKPVSGDVLYLALEDNPRRMKRRMQKYCGLNKEAWPHRFTPATKWRRLDQGGLDALRAWCKSVAKPTLILIDTLKRVRPPRGKNQSDYDADYEACQGLQELAAEFGIAIIVAHHDRKMEADDVFDTVSGTLGLTGGVDTIAIMKRKGSAVTLHIEGRDLVDGVEKAVSFDRETCRWTVLGEAVEVQRSGERHRVLAALTAGPDGMNVSEIVAAASLVNRNAADNLLFHMLKDGEIERVKRGVYGLPGTRDQALAKNATKIAKKERSELSALKNQEDTVRSLNLSNLSQSTHEP